MFCTLVFTCDLLLLSEPSSSFKITTYVCSVGLNITSSYELFPFSQILYCIAVIKGSWNLYFIYDDQLNFLNDLAKTVEQE
jgi:hypothetical protein